MPKKTRPLVFILILLLLNTTACQLGSASLRCQLQISGAVSRDLSEGKIYFEQIPGGYQLFIEQPGGGGDLQVLDILLPLNLATGSYAVGSQGPISANYFESINSVSRVFNGSQSGTITLLGEGSQLNAEVDLSINSSLDPGQVVRVTGTIWNIPAPQINPGQDLAQPGQTNLPGAAMSLGLILFLITLVAANFVFQFMVGAKLYAGEKGIWLRSLRGTATYIRGWTQPDLRPMMILWSIVLAFLLLFVFTVILLSGTLS